MESQGGEMALSDIPFTLDPTCPRDMIYTIPPDVKAAFDLLDAAVRIKCHGILDESTFKLVEEGIVEYVTQAAREGRVGVITNLGDGK